MLSASPYTARQLAEARFLISHPGNFADLPKTERADLFAVAWAVLSEDRAARAKRIPVLRLPPPGHSGDAA